MSYVSQRAGRTARGRERTVAAVTAAVVSSVLLVGCGAAGSGHAASHRPAARRAAASKGATPTSGRRQVVTIDGTDGLRFRPGLVDAHVGTVTITLVDIGAYPHDIEFPTLHVLSRSVSGTPGSMRTTLTVSFPRPGRYPFLCTYHSSAGMRGVFLVTR
jgi:plastocyanin